MKITKSKTLLCLFSVWAFLGMNNCSYLGKKMEKKKHPLENNYTLNKISSEEYIKKGLIPLEDFFKKPEIARIRISPNGKYLAYLKPYKRRLNIHVKKFGGLEPEKRVTSQTDRDIAYFFWKENDTLVFVRDFGGNELYHFFRVSAQSEDEKDLTPFKGVRHTLISDLEDITEDTIIIGSNKRDLKIFDAYRLNVKTGVMEMIAENPGHFTGWMTDHEGQLRIAGSTDGLNSSVYYRDREKDPFQKIFTTNFKNEFAPILFDFKNQNIYVLSNINRDKIALELFNPKTKKTVSSIFSHPEVDVSSLNYSRKDKRITSADYITWRLQYKWFDAKRKRIFKDIEKQFPNKDIFFVSENKNEDRFVVAITSDRLPAVYYLYDTKRKKIEKIAETRPWLKEKALAKMQPITYKSRDDLTIHGYLTLPKGSSGKNLPLLVYPHGGPWGRDVWGYNSELQFLANRGYAVFQMNFRGSTGYGKKFWKASFKQWGQTMQNDITDGVRYLIDQGIADKNKICIYGGSYGGYAVLAGLAFTPDLYACGVDYVGVSNLFTLLESMPPWWELGRKQVYEKIGDPVKDADLLKEASPVFHADQIKAPLFVVHGANDPRVKKAEADQIVSSLDRRGVKPLYMVKYNEGHGFQNEENRIEFYTLLEEFLKEHLQKTDTVHSKL